MIGYGDYDEAGRPIKAKDDLFGGKGWTIITGDESIQVVDDDGLGWTDFRITATAHYPESQDVDPSRPNYHPTPTVITNVEAR